MGWFVVACVAGFVLFWIFRALLPLLAKASSFWIAVAGGAIILALVLFVMFDMDWIRQAIARLGDASGARLSLGLILGAGFGFYWLREFGPQPDGQTDTGRSARMLWVGLTVILLALIAPHIDRWLLHLTSFKTSVVEIQLASIANTNKSIKPDNREFFNDQSILVNVQGYADSIDKDIWLIDLFRLADVKSRLEQAPKDDRLLELQTSLTNQKKQLEELRDAFTTIVGPLARCVKNAIDNGYDIESARNTLRGVGDLLTQISLLQSQKSAEQMLQTKSSEFWEALKKIPPQIALYVTGDIKDQCLNIVSRQVTTFPDSRNYRNLPHLFGAMSFLLTFVNDNIVALRNLESPQAQNLWTFSDDFNVQWLQATLMYYRGDDVSRYAGILEKMRATTKEQRDLIKRVTDRCADKCSPDTKKWGPILTARAQNADYFAMNLLVFGVAEDLAEGLQPAEQLLPIALKYAAELKSKTPDNSDYLDSAEFLFTVAEARKPEPERDLKKINEAVETFSLLIAKLSQKIAHTSSPSKLDYLNLKQLRAHLTSAKGLVQ
jgi:hypothetical protein